MKTYYVRFKDNRDNFLVKIQEEIGTIAEALQYVLARGRSAGEAVGTFIYWVGTENNVSLVKTIPDLRHIEICVWLATEQVTVYEQWLEKKHVFAGSANDFLKWAGQKDEDLVGKTIVFRYTGGSGVENRVVKVERLKRGSDGAAYICGLDVLKQAYRCYDTRKIDGDILIVDTEGAVRVA